MKDGPKQSDCPHSIQSYWYFRDQITCKDRIIYKGTRLIMPKSERASTLKVLHMGHYAIDKMSLRARETVYWPGISEDIRSTYQHCHICAKFARTQQKETLQSVERPQTAWEQLGLDIFSLRNTQYLLVIDYFSQFPVIKLPSLHSVSVIKHLRHLHRNRYSEMYSLRWQHTIHLTRVQRLHKNIGYTTHSHITHKCSLMGKQNVLYRLYKQSHKSHGRRRPTPSNSYIHHNTLEPQSTITCRVTQL